MENFNGNREDYMRSLDNTEKIRRREQRQRNVYDPANSSRFDRREDYLWSTRAHGHNSYEQQFNKHYGADETSRFPESGTNYDTKGVHAGKGPKSYRRTDERLKEIICERLTDDAQVDARDLEIAVSNSEVIITGEVPERNMKRRIEDVIDTINGITHLENRVRVSTRDTARQS